jgi:N-acetylneuraminic acid mutarotase
MYSPSSNSWTRKSDFPGIPRFEPTSFVTGNKVYIGLGHDINGNPFKDFWEYDYETDSWKQISDFPVNEPGPSISFSIGTRGYASRLASNQLWEYNSTTNSWIQKTDLPASVNIYATTIFFSSSTNGYYFTVDQLHKYDPIGDSWTSENTCSHNSQSPSAVF